MGGGLETMWGGYRVEKKREKIGVRQVKAGKNDKGIYVRYSPMNIQTHTNTNTHARRPIFFLSQLE